MKLQELVQTLTMLQMRTEELQKSLGHINNQVIRVQVQIEATIRELEKVAEWAEKPEPRESTLSC